MSECIPGDLQAAVDQNPNDAPRQFTDRRKAPTSPWDAFRRTGRRRQVRREADRQAAYFVDRFDTPTLAFTIAVLLLSVIDGVYTLVLLELNSEEINPLMRLLLDQGQREFLLGKYILTAAGLPFLVVYKNWPLFGTRFRVGYFLPIFVACYVALLLYQLHLLRL